MTRRVSAVDGGRALGCDVGGVKVDGLRYHEVKRRLGLLPPAAPGPTSEEQRRFVGLVQPDVPTVRAGGWVPLAGAAFASLGATLDEFDQYDVGLRMWLSDSTVADLMDADEVVR